jgi:broad specificity phosphatase PhoE
MLQRIIKALSAALCAAGLAAHAADPLPPRKSSLPDPAFALEGKALVEALQKGGFTIYFRHAATDMTQPDAPSFEAADCKAQRNLNAGGRAQTRLIAEGFAAMKLPVGEVFSSPYCRTMDTARGITGRATADDGVIGHPTTNPDAKHDSSSLQRMLGTPPAPGVNRVVVGHLAQVTTFIGLQPIEEGDALVLRAVDNAPKVVARVRPVDWKALALHGERSAEVDPGFALEGADLVKALREGGLTLYIRHGLTESSQRDMPGLDLGSGTCAQQRNLSEAGRAQARSVGAAFVALEIPLGELVASPYCRTMETARLIAGRDAQPLAAVAGGVNSNGKPSFAELGRYLAQRVNKPLPVRVVVGHSNFQEIGGVPPPKEAETLVLRSSGYGWVVLARVRAEDWAALAQRK